MILHLAADGTNWNEGVVVPCTYVNDGEEVVAVIGGVGRLVTVEVAAGHHARVVTKDGRTYWRNVEDLSRLKTTSCGKEDDNGHG